MYRNKTPIAAKMQNALKIGILWKKKSKMFDFSHDEILLGRRYKDLTVEAPIKNAAMSENVVIVMEIPACFIANPTLSW